MADEPTETFVGTDEYAPFWTPEPGGTISGRVVSIHVMQGDYGPTPVVTVENQDGQHAILVKGTVFREEMAERHPKVGDDLAVTYLGRKKPKSGVGQPYHVYKVVGGTEREFDWSAFASDRTSASPPAPTPDVPIAPAPIMTAEQVRQLREAREAQEVQATASAAAEKFGEVPF